MKEFIKDFLFFKSKDEVIWILGIFVWNNILQIILIIINSFLKILTMKKLSLSDYLIYTFAFTIAMILTAQIVGAVINLLK